MSFPGYPGYGGAGSSYPPYPNNSAPNPQAQPQPPSASGSYPNVGFNPQQPNPYPSYPGQPYPQPNVPYQYPSVQPQGNYPPQGSAQYPQAPPAYNYPPGSAFYPPQGSAPNPYPPQGSAPNPYPPQGSAPNPYPPQGSAPNPYPLQGSTPHSSQTQTPIVPHSYAPVPHNNISPSHSHQTHAPPPSASASHFYPTLPTSTSTHGGQLAHSSGPVSKGNPTVRPAHPFDPRADAEALRKAMKGFGTDEKAIINVLARRTNAQRQEIALQFKTLYGKDLISNLKSELSGKFEDLVVAMMRPLYEFLCKEIHDATEGLGTDEDVIIEVICTASNQEIHALKAVYHQMYRRSLEEELRNDTSGNFKRLLISLSVGNRSEDYNVDMAAAQADVQALLRAGELRVGTDESTFNAVLCQRSYPQLQAIMAEYHRTTGHPLEKAVRNEFSGDIQDGLVAILKCAENRPAFFAERLYKSMKGAGTDDRNLVRLIVSRCEKDMEDIKQAFAAKYGKGLDSFISDDTSGDYKKCLLALIGAY